MRYRRALLLTELGFDLGPALAALRRVAPRLEHLVVVVRLPAVDFAWFSGASAPAPEHPSLSSLVGLRALTAQVADRVQFEVAPELNVEAVVDLVVAAGIDLLVLGDRSPHSTAVLGAVYKREAVAILSADADASAKPLEQICCIALGKSGREAIAVFLRDHADASMHVTLLSPGTPHKDELAALVQIAGIHATVHVPTLSAASLRSWLESWTRGRAIDLFVLARVPLPFMLGAARLPAPVLLLPPTPSAQPFWQRSIDLSDLVQDGKVLRTRVDHVAAVGDLSAVPDQLLAFVSEGTVVERALTHAGVLELPCGLDAGPLGVFRAGADAPSDIVTAIEQWVSVIRPSEGRVVLVDAALSDEAWTASRELAARSAAELLAVRLRPNRSCRSIRGRLRDFGLSARVVDARAVLDEGQALDVSELLDAVRLSRVASRLRAGGFSVLAIVHGGVIAPTCHGFSAWSALDVETRALDDPRATFLTPTAALPEHAANEAPIAGNRVEIEIDNARARTWLLEAIAHSTRTVHLQVYMAEDDEVGAAVEIALAAAGARGVRARVLVDSLHGLHGSFGFSNPLLERLSHLPGVEVRTSHPITDTLSLAELKQRDHRKLVVVDGQLAFVGGRNLSHEYYTSFEEAPITTSSLWREVPWLDAGARLEGPAVGALEASFLEAWTDAGGAGFDVVMAAPIGNTAARVVVHRGLRDARALETYLELINGARSQLTVVNGFPLMLELQHALLGALRRGVRVRVLVGHVTPTHSGEIFKGPWAPVRIAATELVHSRVDALSEAGGEIFHFAAPEISGWDPGLGVVHPHVHAKLMSADGLRCTVGSANLDITSAYWESELLLVFEDATLTRALDTELEKIFAHSTLVAREDPAFQLLARRRSWMRRWPGVLSL